MFAAARGGLAAANFIQEFPRPLGRGFFQSSTMYAIIWDGKGAVFACGVRNALCLPRSFSTSVAHVTPWPVEIVGVGGFSVDFISQIILWTIRQH
jgi:hypothetical protein